MTVYAVMFDLFVLATLVFVSPKWGSFLVRPILVTYPHFWWAQHQASLIDATELPDG